MNSTPEEAAADLVGGPPPLLEQMDPAAAAAQQHLHEQEVAETFTTATVSAAMISNVTLNPTKPQSIG